jgi:hypothetical protein
LISGTASPRLSHNSLQRNAKAGVAAHDGARPALVGNVFEKNPVDLGPNADMSAVREMNFFLETKPARGVGKK